MEKSTRSWKQSSWLPTQLPNYLKVALRTMKRDPVNTFINVSGLTIGLACALVIFLFVRHEVSYDRFHDKADRIYRVTNEYTRATGPRHYATTAPPMGPAMVRDLPEVEHAVRFRKVDPSLVRYRDRVYQEDVIFFVDDSFFEVFTFPLAGGVPETALDEPGTVVITQQIAQKYFGDENPVGRQITIDYREDPLILTVTGVLEPFPGNTHLSFGFLISFETFQVPADYPTTLEDWGWISYYTYVLLDEQANAEMVEDKFPSFIQTHREPDRASRTRFFLQPLTEIYFDNTGFVNSPGAMQSGSRLMTYGLSAIGVFLLLIACFNFMNLSTARSFRRAKEAGMRKVCGAHRMHLAGQFIGESLLASFLSLGIALLGLDALVGVLNESFNLDIALSWSDYWGLIPLFIGIALATGLIGGSYPAFIISNFRPSDALRKNVAPGGNVFVRKALVVTQFTLAIILVIGAYFILTQMKYVQNKELGFDKEQVLVIELLNEEARSRYDMVKERMLEHPDVLSISGAESDEMFDNSQNSLPMYPMGAVLEEDSFPMNVYTVGYDFFETMDIRFTEGRPFSREIAGDSTAGIIVNQAAVEAFGWEDPIGEYLRIFELKEGNVIGVVEDFHYASLHEQIQPLVIELEDSDDPSRMFLKLQTDHMGETLSDLETQFSELVVSAPFSYRFLDEHLGQLYRAEQRFSQLVTLFSVLTFMIACMGLYGLISFIIARRTREIGIRKVLGSRISDIVYLLSKEFLGNVLAANLIAWPLAYWITSMWLQNFEYRIEIEFWIFAVAAMLTLGLSWLAVSWQTIRAARMNPVESLKSG